MEISLDLRSGIPIYAQIVEQIENKIANGSLKVGDQLPTVRHLAEELRVNFNTVARAYRMLDEAGLISTQQGRGTYIFEMPTPEIERSLRQQAIRGLTRRYLKDAHALGCSADETKKYFLETLAAWSENPPDVDH